MNFLKQRFSFIHLHLFLCGIGLAGIASIVAIDISSLFIDQISMSVQFFPWVSLSAPTKLSQLFWYAFIVMFLFLYYGILLPWLISIHQSRREEERLAEDSVFIFLPGTVFLTVTFLTNLFVVYLARRGDFFEQIGASFIWIAVLVFPFSSKLIDYFFKKEVSNWKYYKYWVIAMLVGACFAVFSPFLSGRLPVANEFSDIPEYTILNGKLVSNIQYINEHKIGGLVRNDLYHPEETREALDQFGVKIQNAPALASWLLKHEKSGRYYYDSSSQMLYIKNPKWTDLDELAKTIVDPVTRAGLYSAANMSESAPQYSREVVDFVKLNRQELSDQAIAGHYFHHQFTVIGALNEYLLGRPVNEINFIYGWGNSIAFAKLMETLGGLNFERYMQITYAFYPLYFLVLLGVAAYIFRDVRYVLFAAVATLATLLALGFEDIRFAPGFSPIRHFLDLFVLLTFFIFCRTQKIRYFILSAVISVVAIWADKEFGLALFIALIVTAAIIGTRHTSRTNVWIVIILALLSALAVFSQIPVSINQTMQYTMLGVSLPSTPTKLLLGSAIAIGFGYMLLRLSAEKNAYWAATLFWFMYCQGIFIYYIWNPAPNHFMMLGSSWVMLFILMLRQLRTSDFMLARERATLSVATIVASLALVGVSMVYLHDYLAYKRIFETHQVYKWPFEKVDFKTTMDPKFFIEAVRLIKIYDPDKKIYLISKYDDLLPILANKYSGMVYPQLALNLITNREMENVIRRIKTRKPRFLFVDTDIMRTHVGDIYNDSDNLSRVLGNVNMSRGRAMMLENMKGVFEGIEGDYRLVERSPLISVYERKIR